MGGSNAQSERGIHRETEDCGEGRAGRERQRGGSGGLETGGGKTEREREAYGSSLCGAMACWHRGEEGVEDGPREEMGAGGSLVERGDT
eukprot:COSAG02_NODE_1370_length_13018_cov_50.973218_10_plen_89_part_00